MLQKLQLRQWLTYDINYQPTTQAKVLLTLPLAVALSLFVFAYTTNTITNLTFITGAAVVAALYGLGVTALTARAWINFIVIYGAYLCLSHLGLAGSDLLVPGALDQYLRNANFPPGTLYWFYTDLRLDALLIAGIGISSYFLGAQLVNNFATRQTFQELVLNFNSWRRDARRVTFVLGLLFLVFALSYYLWIIMSGRLPIGVSYLTAFEQVKFIPAFPFFGYALSTGITLAMATGTQRQIRLALIIFILTAIPLFLTGNRGEILYPTAACVAIAGIRGWRPSPFLVGAILLILFLLIPLIRSIRLTPVAELPNKEISIDLTDGFIELGWQLSPLMTTIGWIENGEEHANGGTYLFPILRIVGRVLPFVERPPLEGNRLYIAGRLPTQGYTVIAEAFFNFGAWGVVLVLGTLGALFAVANQASSYFSLAFYGVLTSILINNQRNTFVFVPGLVTYLCMIMVSIYLAARIYKIYHNR